MNVDRIDFSRGVPKLGGATLQDDLIILIEKAKTQGERERHEIATELKKALIVHPIPRVERAAVSLIGKRYTFKDGSTAFFKDKQVERLKASSERFASQLEREDLNFPFLSKESFCFIVKNYCGHRSEKWTLKIFVETYKSFGKALWGALYIFELWNISFDVEGVILAFHLLKDDPVVMRRIKWHVENNPHLTVAVLKEMPELDLTLKVDGKRFDELIEASPSVIVEGISVEQFKKIRDKTKVVLQNQHTRLDAASFEKNNPHLRALTIEGYSSFVYPSWLSNFLCPSLKVLSLRQCAIGLEDIHKIGELDLEHLSLAYMECEIFLPQLSRILSRIPSLELRCTHLDLLLWERPQLKRLTLVQFDKAPLLVSQPSITYLGWRSIYSAYEGGWKQLLPYLPNLETLDLSMKDEPVHEVRGWVLNLLADTSIKNVRLRGCSWPSKAIGFNVAPKVEEIDVSGGDFFEGRVLDRVRVLKESCPNLSRIVYSGYEAINYPHVIEALRVKFDGIEFVERELKV